MGWLALSAVLGAGAHAAHRATDAARAALAVDQEWIFLPEPESLKVAVMGYDLVAADVLWVRTVLVFADLLDHPGERESRWLRAMLESVSLLDPVWRTAYLYGGGMLRLVGDLEGSDRLYLRGHEHLPEDASLPFALAMNAYLYREDVEQAVMWLQIASNLPSAPAWYRTAAAGFLDRKGQRAAALRYLREQIEASREEAEREALERKYRALLHDELASQLEEARQAFRARVGRDIRRPEDLGELPPDPEGEGWILAPDGAIRSAARDRVLRERAQRRERALLLELWTAR